MLTTIRNDQRKSRIQRGSFLTFPIDPELFLALEPYSQKAPCADDHTLFHQGDEPIGLYLVHSGIADAIVANEEGQPGLRFHANPGSVLGLPATVSGQPYSLSVIARQGSDIGFVPKAVFERINRTEPTICLSVLKLLAAEVQFARQALYCRMRASAATRY